MRLLILPFILLPILEMLLLFQVADMIGALATLGLVILTAVIGVKVLKQQGWSAFRRANERLNRGELPAREMLEGLFIAVGGAMLLTPGFLTDTLGLICLLPPTRRLIVDRMIRSGRFHVVGGGVGGGPFGRAGRGYDSGDGRGSDVYEGEYTREHPPEQRLDDDERRR